MERRQFLGVVAASSATLAGCLGLGGDDGADADTSSPEAAVETWYEAQNEGDEDLADAVLHSRSPQRPFETRPAPAGGAANVESTTIVAENLAAEEIDQEVRFELEEETVTAVAETENAVVEVEISFESDIPGQTHRHLVARERGEWRVVA